METTLPTPPGFVERHDIRSGAIEREGFNNYGVIFTTYDDPTPEKLDATKLVGAVIENKDLPPGESRRFFTILGGYYMHHVKNAQGNTLSQATHVFGIASDASLGFDIVEGGNIILANSWRLIKGTQDTFDPVRAMDEVRFQEEGWTLIVKESYRERRLYPMSGHQIHITVTCPTITEIQELAAGSTDNAESRQYTVVLEGIPADSYSWNFGDGSPEATTSQPSATHTFARAEEDKTYTITVSVQGPGTCNATASTESIIPRIVTPECPKLEQLDAALDPPQDTGQQVLFTASVANAQGNETYTWDFGDASAQVTTSTPQASHTYARPPGVTKTYTVTVTVRGSGVCSTSESSASTTVTIKGPVVCPEIEQLNATLDPPQDTGQQVLFTASVANAQGNETYTWEFGDASAQVTTSTPQASHTYARSPGVTRTYTVTVTVRGVDECSDSESSASTTVTIVGPVDCPEVTGLTATTSEPVGQTQEVSFAATVDGQGIVEFVWNFGDGKTATSQTPQITHSYTRQPGADRTFTATVTAKGPEPCSSEKSTSVTVKGIAEKPEPCPGAGIACWIPFVLFVVVNALYLLGSSDLTSYVALFVLDVAWIVASLLCLCRPYLPFIKAKQEMEGCRGARLACLLPFVIVLAAVIFFLAASMTLVAMLLVVILAIAWIVLTWGCLCRPYLPFLKK